uniref:VCRL1 variant I n=1 Tax=Ciona intestinalis TaxID=7719 RepID=I3NN97_CIOIN|nr:vCRL1 variant I [Ciona intestinalis]
MGFYKHRYSCIGLFAVLFTHAYTTFGQTTSTCFLGGIGLSGSVAADVYNRSTSATATYTITSYTTAGTCPAVTWSIRLNGLDTEVATYTFATSAATYNPSYTNLNVSATSAGVADQSVVTFQINQLSSNESGIIVFAVNAVTSSALTPPLEILDCNPVNDPGLITSASSSPCGYQCQVEYSCAPSYSGKNVSAVCLANATLSTTPNCDLSSAKTATQLSDGAIAGIVIGCLIVVAIIIVVLIAICCTEICCCTFKILCLSWGTKEYTAGRS